jgi:hypothetical protein
MMKKLLSLLLVLSSIYATHAQIGISVGYASFDKTDIANQFDLMVIDDPGSQTSGLLMSADYWFRLKQKRLEFLPTLFYTNHFTQYKIKNYGFQFRTTIYPFDFAGDCNCPTFSKENELLKKGFFIRLSPGISHWNTKVGSDSSANIGDLDTWVAELSLATGLDFGITNLLTISPEIRFRRTLSSQWNSELDATFDGLSIFEAAIRIGLRFDKKNYGFKRPRRR